jgi:response regulator RpfG family c-di-GMP phosphodiesterase
MRIHIFLGAETISKSAAVLEMADDVVEFHREKFDGSGYVRW